jgi:sec-independent protein translocase protein TatC
MNNPHRDPEAVKPEEEIEDLETLRPMGFMEHLADLHRTLWKSAVSVVIGMVGGWFIAPKVLEHLIARTVKTAYLFSPMEAFNERFKLTFLLGFAIAAPLVFWHLWSFIVPGLLKRERTWVPFLVIGSMLLFGLGAWAAYDYVVPLVISVLDQFLVAGMVTQIRLNELLGFTYNLVLACGILMQLPLVTMLLTAVGLVTPGFLLRQWRAALVVIFIVTAFITPGDVVSAQMVMGVPMVLLYFISVGLSFLVAKKRDDADREAGL